MNELPKNIQDKISEMPEHRYGVHKVILVLDDGTEIYDAYVAWGSEVIKIGDTDEVSFDLARVVDARRQA